MKIQFRSKELIVFESALFRTTTTLIIGDQYILLIDPNWLPIELEFIEDIIQSLGSGYQRYLLFTHSDYDHIIGYGQFKAYKTIASQSFIDNTDKDSVLNQIKVFDDEYYVARKYKVEYPKIETPISEDGLTMQIGNDEYQFYQAKGHNKDGIITYNKSKEILVAGDYLSNIEFPYLYYSLSAYKQTLSKFENLINRDSIKILIPGHGDYTDDNVEMHKRIEESKSYLAEIEASVIEGKEYDTTKLYARYNFPIIMDQFHQNNLKLVKAEVGIA